MLWSWWILPVEEWINGTDRIKGYYERRKTLSVQIQADKVICPLTEQPSSNWHSARGQDAREDRNDTSKNLKPASWCFKIRMQHDSCLDSKPTDLLFKNMSTSVFEMATPGTHTCLGSVSEGVVVFPLFWISSHKSFYLYSSRPKLFIS